MLCLCRVGNDGKDPKTQMREVLFYLNTGLAHQGFVGCENSLLPCFLPYLKHQHSVCCMRLQGVRLRTSVEVGMGWHAWHCDLATVANKNFNYQRED